MKLFGEYLLVDDDSPVAKSMKFQGSNGLSRIFVDGTYVATGNADGTLIEITTLRDSSNVSNVYIEFLSGDTINIADGIFPATPNTANSFIIYQPAYKSVNTSNLTVSTGIGDSVTLINLSSGASNSNVTILVGYRINVNNEISTINFISANTLTVDPGISGNLESNTLIVMIPSIHANSTNSTGNVLVSI
jgi:hypothetical protein